MEQIGLTFWIKLALFCMSLYVVITIFSMLIRRLLHVEKEKSFFYKSINAQHKKWDRVIRIGFIVVMLPIISIGSYWSEPGNIWMFVPIIGTLAFLILTELWKAYMQWRYAENRNDYLYTLIQLVFMISLVIIIVMTDFFGLFY